MKTNWLKLTSNINAKKYRVPDGWETKEQVAASLQCDPDKVASILKPGIDCGDFERNDFQVWDEKRRMAVRVTCYREKPQDGTGSGGKVDTAGKATESLEDRIAAKIRANPGLSNAAIAKKFHIMHGVNAGKVAQVRAKL